MSTKWESYLSYYDDLFSTWRDRQVSLLEIGVQHGGCLETWAEYFTCGLRFVGCDIDLKCNSLRYNDPRISVVVGDINSSVIFREISSISPAFDIIIDDGSHLSADILTSFVNYFPLVKPGGLYVIEDTHALYQDSYGGGILHDGSAYVFFKKLIDVVGFQFWQDQLSISTYLRSFFPLQSTPTFILDGWVESIEFRNSIIKIEKSLVPGHDKIGMAIVSGLNQLI